MPNAENSAFGNQKRRA